MESCRARAGRRRIRAEASTSVGGPFLIGRTTRARRWRAGSPRPTRSSSDEANASGMAPVVFVHGLWLLPSSWDRWAEVFEEAGFVALTPGWPRRSGDRPGGEGTSRGFRQEVGRPGRRPLRRGDRRPEEEARNRRALFRRIDDGDPGRSRPRGGLRGDLTGAVPRRVAAPDLRAQVGVACPLQPRQPEPRRPAHLRPVPLRVRQRRRRGRGEAAV